jgi:hypothetical protein
MYLLGIRPLEPGFTRTLVSPRLADLDWLEGSVPTPQGLIELRAEASRGGWDLSISAPARVRLRFRSPSGFHIDGVSEDEELRPCGTGALSKEYRLRLSGIAPLLRR